MTPAVQIEQIKKEIQRMEQAKSFRPQMEAGIKTRERQIMDMEERIVNDFRWKGTTKCR